MKHKYEKLNDKFEMQYCPLNDYDGSICGHVVIGLPAWFDENPEDRKRLGWIKHLYYDTVAEIKAAVEYNPATQYLIKSEVKIDEYTVKDEYHVIDKTEEMMELEEMLETMNLYVPSGAMILDSQGGALL